MRKRLFAVSLILGLAAAGLGSAVAITDGELDGDGHPYVGLMVAQTAEGAPLWRCSGTLISETVFLTAGHCTESPAAHVEIWFDADVESSIPANGYPFSGDVGGTPHTHPQYNPNAFYLFDLGVVELNEPMAMDEYGELPGLNQLDALARVRRNQGVSFTAVGYGLQKSFPAPVADTALRVRMVAHPTLIQINGGIGGDSSLLLSNNTNTGGTCFGDSGGPNFVGDSNVIAGVTSFGLNGTCGGTGGVYRIDRADDLEWIATFLP
jgi:secreted trypsin-like serine protease